MIDKIIIIFLGLMTLRDIIAFSGIVPQNKKYSWIIYNNYDSYIISETLKSVGIDKQDVKNLIEKKTFEKNHHVISLENLIEIISKYIIYHQGKVQYGYKTPINTTFYISTVEASYEPDYLSWMCFLLNDLVLDNYNKNIIPKLPDFIITPKGGNTHLGRTFADSKNILFVTSKYSVRSTYVTFLKSEYEYNLKTNYEGSWSLLEKQKNSGEDKLYGIVVDCNTTTGEQIIDTINDFNYLISELNLNIEQITDAFTLFRPVDNDKCDIDEKFKRNGFKLHRYFDLTESNKELIIKERGQNDRLNVYLKRDLIKIHKILEEIQLME